MNETPLAMNVFEDVYMDVSCDASYRIVMRDVMEMQRRDKTCTEWLAATANYQFPLR